MEVNITVPNKVIYCDFTLEDIGICADRIYQFHKDYEPLFSTKNSEIWSFKYLHSTFVCDKRRNIANRARALPEGNSQNMHHFISKSEWMDYPIINKIQHDVNDLIGDSDQGALIIDESGIPKKGEHSVGVARQYCGALGKVDNCQVGVFLAYSNGIDTTLIDRRLYIPSNWFTSPVRLLEANVPQDVSFQTKGKLALSMIKQAIANNMQFSFICGDSVYGDLSWFRDALDELKRIYLLEISSKTKVWLSPVKTLVPPKRSKRGRTPSRIQIAEGEPPSQKVRKIADEIPDCQWEHIVVRDGEKKPLEWEFCAIRVITQRDGLPGPWECLIIRRSLDRAEVKFALTNAEEDTPLEIHAERMCRRYWVERSIQIGKSVTGLDEYEVRGFRGWHNHMTMTILAMLFLLKLRVEMQDKAPNLTIEDVRDILETILPKKELTHQELISLIEEKHRARIASKKSHHHRYESKKANQTRASPEVTES